MKIIVALSSIMVCAVILGFTSNAQNKKKVVVTTFTILADMARNVAGDKLTVNSITKVGAETHGYQPTPWVLSKQLFVDG